MFIAVQEPKLSADDSRYIDWLLSDQSADEYPEHLTHGAE